MSYDLFINVRDRHMSIESYRSKLYCEELFTESGIYREQSHLAGRSPGIYPAVPEESDGDCIVVDITGYDFISPSNFKVNLWSDKILSRMSDSCLYVPVWIKWGNLEEPRKIFTFRPNLADLESRGLVFKRDDTYYINTPATVKHFGFDSEELMDGLIVPQAYLEKIRAQKEFDKEYNGLTTDRCNGFGYHGVSRIDKRKWNTTFSIGLEIEKVNELNNKICKDKLFNKYGIIKERDSSLSGEGAFEYVTGIIPFDNIKTILSEIKPIAKLIDLPFPNKNSELSAGGHINISEKGVRGKELARKLKRYMPLLYAIYPKRAFRSSYSTASATDALIDNPDKRAIYPKSDLLELRIFPAVTSMDDLTNRLKLVRYMLKHQYERYSSVVEAVNKDGSELNTIIKSLGDPQEILKRYFIFSRLDKALITGKAKEIGIELGVFEEPKKTFSEWEEINASASHVPNHLRGVAIAMEYKND